MKLSKKFITATILLFSLVAFSACGSAKNEYKTVVEAQKEKQAALDKWAQEALDSGSFDERIEILTEYTDLNDFKNELAFKLSAKLREPAEAEFKKGNLEKAYEMSKKIFKGMALEENIGLLAKVAKGYAQDSLKNKKYPQAIEASSKILELHWDEEAMDIKLAAEYELLKINIEQNDLKEAQKYYDDIMDVTSLKGNENLAKKYRDNTKKYSDKFPESKFNK